MSFKPYIQDIKQILQGARAKTYAAVNAAMVEAYWQIGRRIVEEEQRGEARAAYGEGLLKELSLALTEEFGKGFSAPNLRNFRQFYLTYPDWNICYTLCSKLSWSHNRLIMRVEAEKARAFYLAEAANNAWSVRMLERNINTLYYERLLSSPDKGGDVVQSSALEKQSPRDFIKDPYIFEFLDIPQTHRLSEADLEAALIDNLQGFLLELGKGFSFVGRQFRISTETKHFFIDLVFYNYLLKCFVLIDLKIGELTHQDTGQMDMYIRMFDDLKLSEGDNPTIGVILCSEKDETIVKYSIPKENRQLFASKYRLYLPTEDELVAEIEREKLLLKEKFKEGL
jgi:predicted nuclease of restriction endonuclease-like (RecB) superfamily